MDLHFPTFQKFNVGWKKCHLSGEDSLISHKAIIPRKFDNYCFAHWQYLPCHYNKIISILLTLNKLHNGNVFLKIPCVCLWHQEAMMDTPSITTTLCKQSGNPKPLQFKIQNNHTSPSIGRATTFNKAFGNFKHSDTCFCNQHKYDPLTKDWC